MRHNERASWEGLRSSSMNASHGLWPGGHGLFLDQLHLWGLHFVGRLFFLECDEILKKRGYLSLSPQESSVIPKTSDRCSGFSPCSAGWVHKLRTYGIHVMYRIQELSATGWMDQGSRTTEIEAFWAAHALSQQDGHSARVLNPHDEMVCIMNRSGSTAIQSDHEMVA